MNYIIEEALDYLSSYDICPSKDNIQNVLNEWIANLRSCVKKNIDEYDINRINDCKDCLAEIEKKSEFWEQFVSQKFTDVKVGDLLLAECNPDEPGHEGCEHYFRIESIGYNTQYINEKDNPRGMYCCGTDLSFDDEAIKKLTENKCITIVTEKNFIRFAFVYRKYQ